MRSELAKPPFCHKTKTNGSIGRRELCHTILVEREANNYTECHHERQMKQHERTRFKGNTFTIKSGRMRLKMSLSTKR